MSLFYITQNLMFLHLSLKELPPILSAMAINGYALVGNLKENKATLKLVVKLLKKKIQMIL